MTDYQRCHECNRSISRYSVRRSLKPVVVELSEGHTHHGLAYYRYGICARNHYTKLDRDRVEWSPCMKCRTREFEAARLEEIRTRQAHKKRTKSVRRWRKAIISPPPRRRRHKSVPRKKRLPRFLYKEVYGVSPGVSPGISPGLSSPEIPPPPPCSPPSGE